MRLISVDRPWLPRSGARSQCAVTGTLRQPHRPAPAHRHQIMDEHEHELNIMERSALGSKGQILALLAWPGGAQECAGDSPSLLVTHCSQQHGTTGLEVLHRLMLEEGVCVRNVLCADDSCGSAGCPRAELPALAWPSASPRGGLVSRCCCCGVRMAKRQGTGGVCVCV